MSASKELGERILSKVDIKINGTRPWDIKVHNEKFYDRVAKGGSLALGESYMDGWWDVDELDQFFGRLLTIDVASEVKKDIRAVLQATASVMLNTQNVKKAYSNAQAHYDIGNDLYEKMLDKRMVYTCGYWKDAKNLDEAQEAKLDLVCRKIGLKKGQTVMDIGCGWGSFAKFAAEKYGAVVTGVTVAKEQASLARELCKGLPVEIRLQDYRETEGQFDHIISLGMFEHVGYKNYRTYMEVAARCLKDDGFFLLHTFGGNKSDKTMDPWIDKYAFPGTLVPSIKQVGEAIENIFVMEDWHNFGANYHTTIMEWFKNFDKAWPELEPKYGKDFYRMWKYYLCCTAGTFLSRKNSLWQIVLSKKGVPGGYTSIR